MGFQEDPGRKDEEMLRMEVEVRPGWMPGRRMHLPNAAACEVVVPEKKTGRARRR
jgi:hypothetical protein